MICCRFPFRFGDSNDPDFDGVADFDFRRSGAGNRIPNFAATNAARETIVDHDGHVRWVDERHNGSNHGTLARIGMSRRKIITSLSTNRKGVKAQEEEEEEEEEEKEEKKEEKQRRKI